MMDVFERGDAGEVYARRLLSLYQNGYRIYDPSHALANEPDIEAKLLRHAKIAHALNQRWAKIAGLKWTCEASVDGDEGGALLAQIVARGLGNIRNFTTSRKMLARGDLSGARYAEVRRAKIRARYGDGKLREWIVPVQLKDMPKERFRWHRVPDTDSDVRLEYFPLSGKTKGVWTPVPAHAPLVKVVYDDTEETLGYGRGLREALYFLWYALTHLHRERMDAAERFGQGRLVLKIAGEKDAAVGATNQDIRDRALLTLKKMKARHEFVIGMGDELVQLEGSMTGHEMLSTLTRELEESAVQVILSSVLPTGGGQDKGSMARANVEQDSMDILLSTCAAVLEEALTEGLVVPFVRDNFANFREMGLEDEEHPRFKMLRESKGDPYMNAQRLEIVNRIAPVKRSEFYDLVDLSEPGPDDDVIEPKAAPDPFGGAAVGGGGGVPGGLGSVFDAATKPKQDAPQPPQEPPAPPVAGDEGKPE